MVGSGFDEFAIVERLDVFSGAPQESKASAFGTLGLTLRAKKPVRRG